MSDSATALFDIVFRGDILPGQNVVQVKQRLAQLFKTDEAKINALFSGAATPLKRNLDKATADKYAEVLRKVGADVQVTVAGKVTAKKAPKRQPQPTSLSEPPASIVKPKTLQERLAAQEQERIAAQEKEQKESPPAEQEASSKFTLAPVGSDVLKPEERSHLEPVAVDTSQLSLRESGAELLDASEKAVVDAVQIDVSNLILDEVGADLNDPSLLGDIKSYYASFLGRTKWLSGYDPYDPSYPDGVSAKFLDLPISHVSSS